VFEGPKTIGPFLGIYLREVGMLQLIKDIKELITGSPKDIPTRVAEPTPDWEKKRTEMTIEQLETRLHILEQLQREIHNS
jgi:hypothetical protein